LNTKLKLILGTTATMLGLGLSTVSTTSSVQAKTITAQAGDTIWDFSQQTGVSIEKIEELNNVNTITHIIQVGDSINIPDELINGNSTVTQNVQQPTQPKVETQPVQPTNTQQSTQYQAPVVTPQPVQQVSQPVTQTQTSSAKEWIANKESGGQYSARNGQYVGRYQLTDSYLNGDYSEANQEKVADNYVTSRYGSWEGAKGFWLANGWY